MNTMTMELVRCAPDMSGLTVDGEFVCEIHHYWTTQLKDLKKSEEAELILGQTPYKEYAKQFAKEFQYVKDGHTTYLQATIEI